MKHLVYLGIGIVVTIVFFILSCSDGFNIYEQLFFNQGYNDKMFNLNMYPVIAAITIGLAWGGAAIYYYAINSVRFDRWWHWLAVMAVTVVLTPVACYLVAQAMLSGMDYAHEAVQFQFYNLAVVAVLYVVASFSIKWWSSNCRHSPF